MKDFDLTSLRVFCATVRVGGMSAAGRDLDLAVSAVSRRIAELEAATGQRLLDRGGGGTVPTAAGSMLFERAIHLLSAADALRGDLDDFGLGVTGELRLAAVSAAVSGRLPGDLASFERRYPRVRIVLTEGTSAEVLAAVIEHRADAALVVDHDIPAALVRDEYAEDPVWVIAVEGHPLFQGLAAGQGVRFAEVIRHELVSLERGASIEAMVASAAALIERPVRKHLVVSRYDSLRRLVEAGLGVGFIRRSGVEVYLGALQIEARPLAEDWAHQSIVLVRRPGNESPRVAATFAAFLAERGAVGETEREV